MFRKASEAMRQGGFRQSDADFEFSLASKFAR
jgi:hypothetical protein